MEQLLYSRLQAAKLLGISIASVESLCKSSQLRSIRVGRSVKIHSEDLALFSREGTANRTVTGKPLDPLWQGKK